LRRIAHPELSDEDVAQIRHQADALLRKACANDVFPTPVDRLVRAAGLRVDNGFFTEGDVLKRMEAAPAERVKRARNALIGLVDIPGGIIYVHPNVSLLNLPPLVLHEAAHACLEWQRTLYLYVQEDDACFIANDLKDRFELEANQFAWESIFHGGRFQREAEACTFSLETPLKLARRYGTSAYAAARRFVETNARPCALFIDSRTPGGWRARRPIQSPDFTRRFGHLPWSDDVREGGSGILMAGYGARQTVTVPDLDRRTVECEVHSLAAGNHSFTLLYPKSAISLASFARLHLKPAQGL
jgi:hypothetical protein